MDLLKVFRDVNDFPIEGIVFKDITPVLRDPKAFKYSVDSITAYCRSKNITDIVAPDARGFLWGAPVAYKLGLPLHIVRKAGKLPPPVNKFSYTLEYGEAELELNTDSVFNNKSQVCIIDDVSATGGTANAIVQLLRSAGCIKIDYACVLDLTFLQGTAKLKDYCDVNCFSVAQVNA